MADLTHTPPKGVAVVGGGLAGSEAAWQLAGAGISVTLYEMKPERFSPAHTSPLLGELVCSNSLRSEEPQTAVGLLKEEMAAAGSLVMEAATATRVPAGKALAVDRERFAAHITGRIHSHPLITVVRAEVRGLDDPCLEGFSHIVLTPGPLAGESLTASIMERVGSSQLYFYDAIAPIVQADSIDMGKVFWGSRYRPGDRDYLNCPMTEEQYHAFREALLAGKTVPCRDFEKEIHFEGCLPVETLAQRGPLTMAYGPLKPVGLEDPRTGRRPFAVVQLRAENLEKTMFNLVGFQTKLTYPEQKRIFCIIPGLEQAEFFRLGSIHRNTYVNAPEVLTPELEIKAAPGFFLAGQISGVEGYVESASCGLWVGLHLAGKLCGVKVPPPPLETALGALLGHLRTPVKNFQPMNANFGLTPPLGARAGKKRRKELYAERGRMARESWLFSVREVLSGP
ncbi:MAG: methylenetetrahydrofolate--tRNA-(uracil(54)-C(5))-methyltransferase (FADH(2)-oxidizing) TrmFO [Desulfohalobiaceae bacterium]